MIVKLWWNVCKIYNLKLDIFYCAIASVEGRIRTYISRSVKGHIKPSECMLLSCDLFPCSCTVLLREKNIQTGSIQ